MRPWPCTSWRRADTRCTYELALKLLLLTPQLPYPPHQGTTLRNFNLLKQLAARHTIDLLSLGDPSALEDSPLREYCGEIELAAPPVRSPVKRAVETFVEPLPDMARRLYSEALTEKLAARLRTRAYDVVQIEGIEMAHPWQAARAMAPAARPVVVFDDHNAEWTLQKTAYETDRRIPRRLHGALYSWMQWHKLEQFERAVCLAADAVVAVSQEDAAALAAVDPRIQPTLIPNGVDVDYYVPSEEVCAKPLAELSVVFTGKMDYRPNVDAALWFASEVLPRLRGIIPLAHVTFVGQKPAPDLLALRGRPGIEVTGFVPDTRPYIADAAVFAVPLRMGSGTRLKVLEAMAMGKAIVSTSFGVAGLECENGREVVIADRPDEFAAAIAALIRDRGRARELGAHARALAVQKYDWRQLVPRFEGLYRRPVL